MSWVPGHVRTPPSRGPRRPRRSIEERASALHARTNEQTVLAAIRSACDRDPGAVAAVFPAQPALGLLDETRFTRAGLTAPPAHSRSDCAATATRPSCC